jgi:hypothetical protein
MGDYPTQELLTRMLALERMKKLSDMIAEAKSVHDYPSARMYMEEREGLKKEFLKVVK